MKRTLLTILPIAAALLLATSCSKDSDNDNGTWLSKKSAARNPKQGSVEKNDTSLFF